MAEWIEAARHALPREPVALVTILATEGSAPRGRGTRMVVTLQQSHGTVGGGRLEHQVIAQARAILRHPPGTWRVQDYPLGPLLGQCCGGRVRLLIERVTDMDWADGPTLVELGDTLRRCSLPTCPDDAGQIPLARGPLPLRVLEPAGMPRRPVLLFGGGHVGQAIARLLPGLPLDLAWFDSRPEFDRAGLVIDEDDALVACAGEASPSAAVLILTHDHALDYRLAAAALRSRATFVGLIGSQTKRARFLRRLAAERVDARRLTCPIGMAGITGKEPAVIAVAAVAQLLALCGATEPSSSVQ